MSVQLPLLPQGVGGAEAQALVLALNDRLRRISQALGPGAPGAPGAAGAAGAPGANATGAFRLDINEGQWEPGHTWAMGDMTTFGARHTYVRRVAGGDPAATYTLLDRAGWTAYGSAGASPDLPDATIDGDPATYWGNGVGLPASLWFDLGAARIFSQVQWTGDNIYGPSSVEIYVSDDGVTWELVFADSFVPPGGFDQVFKMAFPSQTRRWVKVSALTAIVDKPLCKEFNLATPTVAAAPDVDTVNWLAIS